MDHKAGEHETLTLEQRLAWLWVFWKRCLVRQFCWKAWPLAVLWVVPMAMVLGAGEGFGMPKLFWGGRGLREAFVSGVALLVLFVWMTYCGFVLDWTSRDSPMRKEIAGPRGWWRRKVAFGWYLLAMGFWVLVMLLVGAGLREVGRFVASHAETLPYVVGPLVVVMIGAGMWSWQKSRQARRKRAAVTAAAAAAEAQPRWRMEFVALPALFLMVLWSVRAIGAAVLLKEPDAAKGAEVYWEVKNAELVSVLSWSLATLAVAAVGWRRLPVERSRETERAWAEGYREREVAAGGGAVGRREDKGALWWMRWSVAGLALVVVANTLLPRPLNAAVSICVFVMGAATVLVVGRAYVGLPWVVILAMAVGLRAFGGAVAGKVATPNGLPSLAAFYEETPRRSVTASGKDEARREKSKEESGATQKRPLIVVCASGGGISAAAWTMSVLTRLEELNAEFPYSVRVITGASGGMLGAAYYVGTLMPRRGPGDDGPPEPQHQDLKRKELKRADLVHRIADDSLSRVAHTMLLNDLPDGVTPWGSMYDRGRALEAAWLWNTDGGMGRTFAEMQDEELAWRRPSLIFSPMMVEDGRRLLISNLPLDGLIGTGGSQDGVDFFGVYPEARARMSLATAARLSAGFPFVSPAPVLPFAERRRAVDAGYFDNHGTELACRWLRANSAWVDEHASSVMLLHIRTYKREEPVEGAGGMGAAFSELSAPVKGLMSGRSAMMEFGNDRDVEQLTEDYFSRGLPPMRSVTIQCPLEDLPLTWMLSNAETKRIIESPVSDRGVNDQLVEVARWLSGGAARPWRLDRAVEVFRAGEEEKGPGATQRTVHRLRFAISEGEVSSWMLYKPGLEFDGFEVAMMHEVTRRVGEKLGLKPEDVEAVRVGPVAWEQLFELPRRGVADLVVSSISFTPEREHNHALKFSVPYHKTKQVAVWKGKGTAMPPFEGKVAVQEDTTSAKLLAAMIEKERVPKDKVTVVSAESLVEIVGWLLEKRPDRRVDFVLTDEPYTTLLNSIMGIENNEADRVQFGALSAELTNGLREAVHERDEYYCIGVADDCPQLLWLVNTVMTEMTEDGTMARIVAAYRANAAAWSKEGRWRVGEVLEGARPK